MIENNLVLIVLACLTLSSKENRAVGFMVITYYLLYFIVDTQEFIGAVESITFVNKDLSVSWYIICMSMSCMFSVWASYIYMIQGGAVWVYSAWLILDALLCSILALSQSFETNALLTLYNVLQNINLYADIIIVVVSTDNVLKRNSNFAARIIDGINMRSERWLDMVFNSGIKSAPKCKKKSTT